MNVPFPVLMLAALCHPFAYPLIAELWCALVIVGMVVLAMAWHHGLRAAARFNAWLYCRRGARELLRELQNAAEPVDSRPQMPGHVLQPRRRIPLRRLPMRPERRNPIKTRKVR